MHVSLILVGLAGTALANPLFERAAKCPQYVKANGCKHRVSCNTAVTQAASSGDYGTQSSLKACVAKCTYDTGCAIAQWVSSTGACTGYNDVTGTAPQDGTYITSHTPKCTN